MRNCCSAVLSWRQSSSKAARGASATHWHGPGIRPAILGVAQALRRLLSVQGCATYRDLSGRQGHSERAALHSHAQTKSVCNAVSDLFSFVFSTELAQCTHKPES